MNVNAQLQTKLIEGLDAMSIVLNEVQQQQLINYVLLINKWNKVHNLTAIRNPLDMITLHVLDSLSVLKHVQALQPEFLLDVGAGAGLPSIPLAICSPELQLSAIDAVQKKASFMRQAKGELGLNNLSVLAGRVESFRPNQPFDVVISRAFSDIALFVKLTKHLLAPTGVWLAMKGVVPNQELADANVRPSTIDLLKVAGLDAERHLITIKRTDVI
jgi:16S rRNA (guanine527-N7)-methyltransferase